MYFRENWKTKKVFLHQTKAFCHVYLNYMFILSYCLVFRPEIYNNFNFFKIFSKLVSCGLILWFSSAVFSETVNFRLLVLLTLLISIISPTPDTGQNQNMKIFNFFQITKFAILVLGVRIHPNGLLFFIRKLFNVIEKFLRHRIPDKISNELVKR